MSHVRSEEVNVRTHTSQTFECYNNNKMKVQMKLSGMNEPIVCVLLTTLTS